jgi:hypothetical protein
MRSRQDNEIPGMRFQKTKTGFHGSLLDAITFSTSTPSCATALLGLPWDEPPSLERVADTGKILPVDAGTCLDIEHCKFGAGHQCDLRRA